MVFALMSRLKLMTQRPNHNSLYKIYMKILQISIADVNGGAEKIAWDLHQAYLARDHQACLVVGTKQSSAPHIIGLQPARRSLEWFGYKVLRKLEYWSGIQAMGYWQFARWWRDHKKEWDIVHVHNLHSSYFDLGALPQISSDAPVVQTLHDCWHLTGHCASPVSASEQGCERWQQGCGQCPDLAAYPPVKLDHTDFNWRRKRRIYTQVQPVLVTPSRWLQSFVSASHLKELRCEVIHNGVDVQRFKPGDKRQTRLQLGLPEESKLLLYVANGGIGVSPNRDPALALASLRSLIQSGHYPDVVLVAVGGEVELPQDLIPYVIQRDFLKEGIELYYQAADVYLHPTKADNFPVATIEAMVSGLPVVTTDVGGCNEQVIHGQTGYIVASGDAEALSAVTARLLDGEAEAMGKRAAELARSEFSLSRMVNSYLALYQEHITEKG